MRRIQSKFQFESNVLIVACALGFIRSLSAVIDDLSDSVIHSDYWADFSFTLLFLFMGIFLVLKKASKGSLIIFYVAFISLLVITFINSNGLQSSTEHNIFAGLILIFFTLRNRLPIYLSFLLIVSVLGALLYLDYKYGFSVDYVDRHFSDINFLFATLGTIGFTFFAKSVFEKRRRELKFNTKLLIRKSEELTKKNEELMLQKDALEQLTLELDNKVIARTAALKSQKSKREKYISITFNELIHKYKDTLDTINNLNKMQGNSEYLSMLNRSAERLTLELEELKKKVNASN